MDRGKKLLGYFKPYIGLLVSDLVLASLGAGVSLIIPLLVRYITEHMGGMESSAILAMVLKIGGIMVFLVLVEALCNFYITKYGHMMGAKMEADMRNDIFEHYQKLSFGFYDNQKVGQLMSRVTNDLFDITELLHHGPEDILISVVKFIGSFSILCSINWKLTLIAFAVIPIMVIYAFYFNKRMKAAFKRNREKIADINSIIEDNLSGIRVVKSFAGEEQELTKFHKGNGHFVEAKRMSYHYMAWYHSGLNALTALVTVVVLVFGALFISKDGLDVTDLITFLLYISNFTDPVKRLVNFTEQFQNGYSGYERFCEILEVEPDIRDKKDAVPLKDVHGEIAFEDVSFCYDKHLDKVLNHVDLQVKAGEYVAIVGSSGGGKTTMCSLIPRFYDVTGGRITIDGVDVRDVRLKSLRENIGIVQQDVYLFAGTVMENIRYGRYNATDQEVMEAAKLANAHEFIMGLEDGYNTDIGQRGIKLSGGQKQRLSIARVFLKNPPILIFDEATSALDNESEKIVQDSLERLAHNRTTFVIAHRLTTIRNAKRILVLTENGIEEQGTHQELMEKNGIYRKLYTM